jgi:hypothetical protein
MKYKSHLSPFLSLSCHQLFIRVSNHGRLQSIDICGLSIAAHHHSKLWATFREKKNFIRVSDFLQILKNFIFSVSGLNFVAVAPSLPADVSLKVGGVTAGRRVSPDRVVVWTSRQRRYLLPGTRRRRRSLRPGDGKHRGTFSETDLFQ